MKPSKLIQDLSWFARELGKSGLPRGEQSVEPLMGRLHPVVRPESGLMIIKATVREGRLVVDEPMTLPEGAEVELLPLDPGDWLDDADRAALANRD